MKKSSKTFEFQLERTIPAPPRNAFNAWMDPKSPCNIWNHVEKFLLELKVDGFFYLRTNNEYAIYGRFTKVEPPNRIQHTWVSPITLGQETMVTVTFKKKGEGMRMTLSHSGLPNTKEGRSHEAGWTYFLDKLTKHFDDRTRSRK